MTKLTELTISSYSKPVRDKATKTFGVMFNPSDYTLSYAASYDDTSTAGSGSRQQIYRSTDSSSLNLKLVFDNGPPGDLPIKALVGFGSGRSKVLSIPDRVDEFRKLTIEMKGELHQPSYLKIQWGEMIYDCRLTSLSVNYTHFDRKGVALRAVLNCTFIHDDFVPYLNAKENKQSPDLTHFHGVIAGDSLPAITEEMYGDPRYYLQLAKWNRLDNFRKLQPGQQLQCPPLDQLLLKSTVGRGVV